MTPDPNFAFFGVPCCLTLDFVFAFWIIWLRLTLHILTRDDGLELYRSSTFPCVVKGDWMARSLEWDRKKRGPVSQQVWNDKDLPLLKGPEHSDIDLDFAALHW
jgi:hypothetical protein